MIYYVNNKIYDWNYADDNIIKVYRHNAICYYKMVAGKQEPCYSVVDDISQYSDTEFIDVYDKATEKWYKLNNLNEFEEYGIYGNGTGITYYEGKLTIDTNKEYIYSGSGWTYVGDVSGGTTNLPDVAFSLNYNAKDYDATNHLFPKTSGQSVNVDATLQGTYGLTAHTEDGYVSYSGARGQSGALIGGYQNYINRGNTSGNCELTIVSKQKRTGNNRNAHSLLANRSISNYNWMWRIKNGIATLHGNSETGNIAISTSEPNITSVRVGYDGGVKVYYNNWTQETSTSPQSFTYGNQNNVGFALFNGYYGDSTSIEVFEGDFYWVYMTPNELTDEQIQAVIDFNEGGGTTVYPLYYTVKQDPPQNLVFTDMAEAEAYRCPYVGLKATIGGEKYIFNANYEWEKYL